MPCSATSSLKHLVKWPNTNKLILKKYFQIFTYRILLYYFCNNVYSTCKVHCMLRKLYHVICDVPDSITFIVKEMFQFKESVCIHKCIFNYLKIFHLHCSKLKKSQDCSQMQLDIYFSCVFYQDRKLKKTSNNFDLFAPSTREINV